MNRKGSMELSVNSIVILVIAIVIMGLILGFIKSKFNDISPGLEKDEPEPSVATSSSPIELSRTTIGSTPGGTAVIKVSIYNTQTDPKSQVFPELKSCTALQIDAAGGKKDIAAGQSVSYSMILKMKNGAAKDSYLCQISVNGINDANGNSLITPKDVVIKLQ